MELNSYSYFIIFLHEFSVSLDNSLVFLFEPHDLIVTSSPCTHKHTLTGACTRMKKCTIQKSSCGLSLNIFPEKDRGGRDRRLSSSMAPLEPQLCHFERLLHTQRYTQDFCYSYSSAHFCALLAHECPAANSHTCSISYLFPATL